MNHNVQICSHQEGIAAEFFHHVRPPRTTYQWETAVELRLVKLVKDRTVFLQCLYVSTSQIVKGERVVISQLREKERMLNILFSFIYYYYLYLGDNML